MPGQALPSDMPVSDYFLRLIIIMLRFFSIRSSLCKDNGKRDDND